MKIINFKNFDLSKIKNPDKYELKNGYVFVDKKSTILGYCLLKENNKNIQIDWIYSKKGYGTDFLKRLERTLFKKYSKITLNLSIDPIEYKSDKNVVMRRINFYIKNNYRVFDIKFRKKHGPLLKMYKNK